MRTPGFSFLFLFAQPFCACVLKILPWGRSWRHATPFSSLSLSPLASPLYANAFFPIRSEVFPPFPPPSQIMSREIRGKERERDSIDRPSVLD